ncbi:MAG: hypothetical protein ABFD23_03640 [Caldisericales bacterium]|nr:hypothetical protein [bacterium]
MRDANIVMPNLTPPKYRVLCEIFLTRPVPTRPQSSAVFAWNSELSLLAAGSAQGLAGGERVKLLLSFRFSEAI